MKPITNIVASLKRKGYRSLATALTAIAADEPAAQPAEQIAPPPELPPAPKEQAPAPAALEEGDVYYNLDVDDSLGSPTYKNRKTGKTLEMPHDLWSDLVIIAPDWYAGQGDPLYAFQSSGDVSAETMAGISYNLNAIVRDYQQHPENYDIDDVDAPDYGDHADILKVEEVAGQLDAFMEQLKQLDEDGPVGAAVKRLLHGARLGASRHACAIS